MSHAYNEYSLSMANKNDPLAANKIAPPNLKKLGARFGFYHKVYVIDPEQTGQSGAHLVRCDMLNERGEFLKFAVAKKFTDYQAFLAEYTKMNQAQDPMQTIAGMTSSYGWVKVEAHKNKDGTKNISAKWYLISEYMNQGTLLKLRDFLNQQQIDIVQKCQILQPLVANIFQGLFELHNANTHHLDIKPENIMLKWASNVDDNKKYNLGDLLANKLKAKLIDFGGSIVAPDGRIRSGEADSRYMSPQKLGLYRVFNFTDRNGIQAQPMHDDDKTRRSFSGPAEDA